MTRERLRIRSIRHERARLIGVALAVGALAGASLSALSDGPGRHAPETADAVDSVERLRTEIESARHTAQTREASLLARITALEERVGEADLSSPLRPVAEGTERSVFLIRCSYGFRVRDRDGRWDERRSTTWGTAFCVSSDGRLVTNKHLVEPWKFDAELGALLAWGEAEVDEASARLLAWPAGARCLDEAGEPEVRTAYSSAPGEGVGRLTVWSKAPDAFEERVARLGGLPVRHRLHRLDEHDLAILRLDGGTFVPLPCLTDPATEPAGRLDPVLAIGFPRGGRALEHRLAEPSFATGVVRRVGASILTTVPMASGNSGGPLLDELGRVIGVATCVYGETESSAVRIGDALALLDRAQSSGDRRVVAEAAPPSASAVEEMDAEALDPPLASR